MMLEALFGSILELDPDELTDDFTRSATLSWDSLAHINIITALEETYSITFSTDEIANIQSLGDVRKFLHMKGVAI